MRKWLPSQRIYIKRKTRLSFLHDMIVNVIVFFYVVSRYVAVLHLFLRFFNFAV